MVALVAMLNGCAGNHAEVADEPAKAAGTEMATAGADATSMPPAVDPRDETIKALREALKQVNARVATLQAGQDSGAKSLAAAVDLNIYERNMGRSAHNQVVLALREHGFVPDYPSLPQGMGMASKTTVFYYDAGYIETAGVVAQLLARVLKTNVTIQKGVSQMPANKLIAQISGVHWQ